MIPPDSAAPPRRRWGQNFLRDARTAERLVRAFEIGPDDAVIEIGPGRGAITGLLAGQARRLVALEIDPARIAELEALLAAHPGAEVRLADALEVDFDALNRELGGGARVVGNLPYNVGTAIVRRLLRTPGLADVQVLLQKEVTERILAEPGVKAYGPLSVIAALRGSRKGLVDLAPGAFTPQPKVWSRAVRLRPAPGAPLPPERVEWLEAWLFRGFGHRRKVLAGNLGAHREVVHEVLEGAGLPRDARAEVLPPRVWLELATRLDPPQNL